MTNNQIVDRETWLQARLTLLEQEKAFTRARDELSEARRRLPWVRVEQDYTFDSEAGVETLADLFAGRSQLVVQHFMYAPGWQEGCKSCSFWADNLSGALPHLAARDVTLVAVSQAPWVDFAGFKERMGWRVHWVSSASGQFSHDYHVWYTPEQIAAGDTFYNYRDGFHYGEHSPGFSVFVKGEDGAVYHTYSCYARGLDMLNGAYHVLDMVPKGRDEQDLPANMAWLHLHDSYPA
ncbi:MAG: DUF899 domain-containing protein [Gammaproteobacteria bacterium]|nr:DUF899 domain-containing protein [Gammaproteobacteria bacterium]